jgi:Outer membrane protein transport protein (OMPP1/FadL/TodX)
MSLCVFAGIIAQNVDDVLRYSQIYYGGTARFMSMGGAFTALGGDLSSLSQNPAGLGVFRSSELTITPQLFHIKTSAGFNGTTSDFLYNFNLNQLGIVSNLISNNNETGLVSLNVGYSFNRTNNLNQSILIRGLSTSSSMADYWAGIGEGTFYKDLAGAEGIAYDAWVIDTITGSGQKSYGTVYSNYGDNFPSKYGQTIRRLVSNEGYTGEHAISIGGNYSNKIFFGATLGINKLRYTSHYEHQESTDVALASQFQNFTYTDHFEDKGTGYTLKLGAIFKPIDAVRIGLAFHSPTWYKIDEYYYNDMTSNFTDGAKYEFSNAPMRFNYALTTPFRVLAGVAVQIKKIALLSADYEFVDYSTAKFKQTGDGYDYSEKNLSIKNSLKSTSNIRLGGELRLNNLYLRTGYAYYGKAFQPGEDNANLDYSSMSFGAGFREQNVSIDFAFTNYNYSQKYFLYPLDNSFDPALARLNTIKNMFTLTFGYKFGI